MRKSSEATEDRKRRSAAQLLSRLSEEPAIEGVANLLKDIDKELVRESLLFVKSLLSQDAQDAQDDIAGGETCLLYVDGASIGNPGPAGAGVFIMDESGVELAALSENLGTTTSNVAEYKALILGLKEAGRLGFSSVKIFTDSELVANQVRGDWRIKDKKLKPLADEARKLLNKFDHHEITSIDRANNKRADKLAKRAADQGT
jgi:ribonuclease HI